MRYTWSRMETVMIATSENIQKQEEMKSIYVFSNGLLRNNVIKWNLKKKKNRNLSFGEARKQKL